MLRSLCLVSALLGNISVALAQDSTILPKKENEAIVKELGIDEITITGTMKPVKKSESPVSVEVFTPTFFKKNPTPNIFDALQNVNGVRPQINCNVCNTGDIKINGLDGAYTMVLIDGMPIVSSLGTVYGLSGIPNALVERIEVVKGPASSLYGSEAVGGLINIITKKPQNAPLFSVDTFSTTWGEYNTDIGAKFNLGKKISVLTGINYFNYQNKKDHNKDNFTDVTLQDRVSVFQKWNIQRDSNKLFALSGRYFYEDRWGGEMNWNKSYRGGEDVYGESIYTNRAELIGTYQLPTEENIFLGFSYVNHQQDSRYGSTSYIAKQNIAFGQLTWDKTIGNHSLLAGTVMKYSFYDDNTPATEKKAEKTYIPGIFLQNEWSITPKHKLLLGARYDYHNVHRNIFTPRIAYKWNLDDHSIIRLNAGTGFRVVNLFTEDHAALTGARDVIIKNDLKPERSYNVNLNFDKKFYLESGAVFDVDLSAFYTHFSNRIEPDYTTNANQIIYDNIENGAISKGVSLSVNAALPSGLKLMLGGTLMKNTVTEDGMKVDRMLTERFAGNWAISYNIRPLHLSIDYTGNVFSPMRLPLLGDLDPRKPKSPWWSIQNIQFTYNGFKQFEIYAGVKNLLNFLPTKGNPFIIARSHDPFDKDVQFDADGNAIATANNPYGLTFDPTYVYAPNQGIRGFLGIRLKLK